MPATTGVGSFPGDGVGTRGLNESVRVMTQRRQEQTWSESDPESDVADEMSVVAFRVMEMLAQERMPATCMS